MYVDATKKSQKISAWNEQNEILEFLSLDILHTDIVLTDINTKKRKEKTYKLTTNKHSVDQFNAIDPSICPILLLVVLYCWWCFQISKFSYHSMVIQIKFINSIFKYLIPLRCFLWYFYLENLLCIQFSLYFEEFSCDQLNELVESNHMKCMHMFFALLFIS